MVGSIQGSVTPQSVRHGITRPLAPVEWVSKSPTVCIKSRWNYIHTITYNNRNLSNTNKHKDGKKIQLSMQYMYLFKILTTCVQCQSIKFYPSVRFSGSISPMSWDFKIKSYTPMQNYKILFSYLKLWQSCATLSAICWWIFLHFTIKQQIIVISLQQYDQSPQNLVQWCRTYLWCAQPPSWYLLWCRTGLSGVSAVCYLGFYK